MDLRSPYTVHFIRHMAALTSIPTPCQCKGSKTRPYLCISRCVDVEVEAVFADPLGTDVLRDGQVTWQQLGTPRRVLCGLKDPGDGKHSSKRNKTYVSTLNELAPFFLDRRLVPFKRFLLSEIRTYCGSFHLRSPTGGLAYGTERNT